MLTNGADKDVKWTALNVSSATEINELNIPLAIENDIFVFDVAVDNQRFGVQEMNGLRNLAKYAAALGLFHVGPQLNVVKEIHAGETVGCHLDVVVDVILKEALHLDNVGVAELGLFEVVHDVNLKRHGAELPIACPCVDEDAPLRHVFEHHLFASNLVSSKFDLAVCALAHFFQDGVVVNGDLARRVFWLGGRGRYYGVLGRGASTAC